MAEGFLLQPGDVPTLRIPVVNAAGAPQGLRAVQCAAAGPDGRSVCVGAVAEPGLLPQLGGIIDVRLARNPAAAQPLLPPPPPPRLVPLAPPALPAPAGGQPAAPGFPEVPVIPEAESLVLLGIGLAALSALLGLRALRRRDG